MKKGFTIIELLVSMGIFIVVTTMVVANFRAGSRSDELKIAAETLVSNLRRAQNMALAGQLTNGMTPQGGYGVYFKLADVDHYVIFANNSGNLVYDDGEALADGVITLPLNVKLEKIEKSSGAALFGDVVFKPPKPVIYICKTGVTPCQTEDALFITLKHTLSNKTQQVSVNRVSGRINVE